MSNTVVGLYRTDAEVQKVVDDLASHDFPRRSITLHDSADDLHDRLTGQGVPAREADEYVEGVRNGGRLVTLEASEDRTSEAVEIMRRHEQHATGAAATTERDAATARGRTERTRADGEEVLEVTEEELEVGTRQVERGGVQVRTYVTERPVEETVRVRDETVHVDRRPADRPVSEAEAEDAFRERTVEMTETDEEVVVGKRARVIAEVTLSKDVEERAETVRDTVRRTDVEVEEAGGSRAGGYVFEDDREHFRTHHRDAFRDAEYGYDEFEPAYRYGTSLATHPDYREHDWNEISPAARDRWEERNRGTWDEFEPAVRYGYDRAHGRSDR